MSKKAEEAALKAYPVHSVLIHPARQGGYYADNHLREGFAKGYEQAERDLALTPDDIKLITKIHYEIVFKDTTGVKVGDVPSEVLRRFNELRKEEKL